jgi:DNA-binding HxlR family transcriptional regulator
MSNQSLSKLSHQTTNAIQRSTTHDVSGCAPARDVLTRLGDKWSMLIVILLGDGPLRFNELKRHSVGISQRILSLTLKSLERDGIISRHVEVTVPISVDYKLTPLGHSLWSVVKSVGQWAGENFLTIEAARANFDRHATRPSPEKSDNGARVIRF